MKDSKTKKVKKDMPPAQAPTFGGQPTGSTTLGSLIGYPGAGKSEWDHRVNVLKQELESWAPGFSKNQFLHHEEAAHRVLTGSEKLSSVLPKVAPHERTRVLDQLRTKKEHLEKEMSELD